MQIQAPPTPERLWRRILRRTNDMATANTVRLVAKRIDEVREILKYDDSPQTVAQVIGGLIRLTVEADQALADNPIFTEDVVRILSPQEITQALNEKYAVEAPGLAEYIDRKLAKIRADLEDVREAADAACVISDIADLAAELQCVLRGHSDGRMEYRNGEIKLICE